MSYTYIIIYNLSVLFIISGLSLVKIAIRSFDIYIIISTSSIRRRTGILTTWVADFHAQNLHVCLTPCEWLRHSILNLSFARLLTNHVCSEWHFSQLTWRTISRRHRKLPRNKVQLSSFARGTSRRQTRLILPQLLNSPPSLKERQF